MEVDAIHGPSHDLCDKKLQRRVRGWINNGRVAAVWMAFPRATLTAGRGRTGRGPLRDSKAVARPCLSPEEEYDCCRADMLVKFAASVVGLCAKLKVPVGLEFADNSLLWRSIQMQHALRNCRTVRFSRCAFGGRYRHKMRVSFFHVPLEINPTVRLCSDKHTCTFSRKRHLIPTGSARGGLRNPHAGALPQRIGCIPRNRLPACPRDQGHKSL